MESYFQNFQKYRQDLLTKSQELVVLKQNYGTKRRMVEMNIVYLWSTIQDLDEQLALNEDEKQCLQKKIQNLKEDSSFMAKLESAVAEEEQLYEFKHNDEQTRYRQLKEILEQMKSNIHAGHLSYASVDDAITHWKRGYQRRLEALTRKD